MRTLRDLRVPRLDGAKQRKDSPAVLLQRCKSEDHTQVLKAALYLSHVYWCIWISLLTTFTISTQPLITSDLVSGRG